ncbi:aminopeptidase [Halobiforma lacisalsi AJ5]|uniref:Carboxypeptidase Q n=1 Tax=Natronobacterium lacisalsi AJ5 TaxID=358396 RepID=M0M0V4_NATLA|nr:M28 family metallopeptidase [Halobiforma lacisalsi]APW97436.1 aminopeptidase [Halobiforma lacisalsi AJ5]EMA38264.1 peptidase M28 [Halobiforma lacisalsi AJ5]
MSERDATDDSGEPDTNPTLERALGRAWRDDRPWELLTRLTELPHRMGGSEHERRAAELVAEAFENAGLEAVEHREFPMRRWHRGRTEFTVVREDAPERDRPFAAIALPYSPAGDVEGPLVDVGYGTPEEIAEAGNDAGLEGAIAVASTTTPSGERFVHRMEKFGHAVDAGADAFVFVNHVEGQLPPTGALEFADEADAPGIGVSAETGDWLAEYADRGARARISVEATTEDATSRNVSGVVGPDTDEEVVVLAHYDSHDVAEGALDNGCGIATVAGAAPILAALEDDLERRVRLVGVGCEEIGLLGAEALAEELDLESVHAVVNVDGAGRFRNLVAIAHGSDDLGDLAERVTGEAGQPVVRDDDPHPFSDHWPFLRAGVPSLQLHSDPPEGGDRGRGWGHTAADTRDKVDPRNLREHAMLTALVTLEIAGTSVSRIAVEDLRERLREQEYEPGMRAADIWPEEWDER